MLAGRWAPSSANGIETLRAGPHGLSKQTFDAVGRVEEQEPAALHALPTFQVEAHLVGPVDKRTLRRGAGGTSANTLSYPRLSLIHI